MCVGYGVEIVGEMQVYFFYWYDLCYVVVCSFVFYVEIWVKVCFVDVDGGVFVDVVQCVVQIDCCGGFVFVCWGWVDCGDQYQLILWVVCQFGYEFMCQFGFVMVIGQEICRFYVQFGCDFGNGVFLCCVGDLDVGFYGFFWLNVLV